MSARSPTNADLMRSLGEMETRLAEVDRQVTVLQTGQTVLGERVDLLERRWDTVAALLANVLSRLGEQGERVMVLLESHKELARKIDNLACSPLRKRSGDDETS